MLDLKESLTGWIDLQTLFFVSTEIKKITTFKSIQNEKSSC